LPVGISEDGIDYAIGQAHHILAFCEGSMEICGHGFGIHVLASRYERSGERPVGSALEDVN
jgi:hypothetical protein